ncbi:superoxide dismutase family protein [Agathobaculum sp. NTUH-O15-33]|uniref:superoxide dismutase family protein n=1 Tax=Agathobaculum sp. NTUH-O15-33 TaxID=3079302 RepID=UPI00295850B4|nr:superoxide dismutase family protein [Agathobaculum sp. NTUH-O15-33]WNX84158.1 superoxide dismutase family protein [Agathobaculum sp. NTUH-O15-33]
MTNTQYFANVMGNSLPDAAAVLQGAPNGRRIEGTVSFYQTPQGVLVTAAVRGLPVTRMACAQPIFALHVHEGTACTGNASDPFANAGMHFNPGGCPHPYHAGDLPPLFSDRTGFAWMAVLTDRFTVRDVLGKAVIVHSKPDDFKTQPSGDAGAKLACGIITPTRRDGVSG